MPEKKLLSDPFLVYFAIVLLRIVAENESFGSIILLLFGFLPKKEKKNIYH